MGVSGWKFLLVPAYPGCPGSKAVKRSCVCVCVCTIHTTTYNTVINHGSSSPSTPDRHLSWTASWSQLATSSGRRHTRSKWLDQIRSDNNLHSPADLWRCVILKVIPGWWSGIRQWSQLTMTLAINGSVIKLNVNYQWMTAIHSVSKWISREYTGLLTW